MVVVPLMGWSNVDDDDACGPQYGELEEQTTFFMVVAAAISHPDDDSNQTLPPILSMAAVPGQS